METLKVGTCPDWSDMAVPPPPGKRTTDKIFQAVLIVKRTSIHSQSLNENVNKQFLAQGGILWQFFQRGKFSFPKFSRIKLEFENFISIPWNVLWNSPLYPCSCLLVQMSSALRTPLSSQKTFRAILIKP